MPHKTANHQSLKYFFLVENEEPPISKKRGSMHTSIKITGIGENAEKNEEKSSQPMVASSLLRRASFLFTFLENESVFLCTQFSEICGCSKCESELNVQ